MTETRPIEPDLLRDALKGERTDPAAFLAGVRERVDARAAAPPRTLTPIPPRWRWAASLLPPGVVPLMTATGGAGVKLSWKALPGLAALPGIAFLMVLVSFVGGLRQLRKLDDEAVHSKLEDEARVRHEWWTRHRTKALLGIAAIVVLVLIGSPSAALFGVLASMVALVLLVGVLARAGYANRKAVGRLCIGVLSTNAWCWWSAHEFLSRPAIGPHGEEIAVSFAIGILLCSFASGSITWAIIRHRVMHPIKMKHPDPVTTFSLRCLSFPIFGLIALVVIGWCIALPFSFTDSHARFWSSEVRRSRERPLSAWVADHTSEEFLADERLISIARGLRSMGALGGWLYPPQELKDRLRLEPALVEDRAIRAEYLVLDWIDEVQFSDDEAARVRRQLLESDQPLAWNPDLFVGTRQLRDSHEVHSDQLSLWRARIIAGWSQREYHELEEDLRVVRWLESLGGTGEIAASTSRLHADLLEVWNGGDGRGPALFEWSRPSGGQHGQWWHGDLQNPSDLQATRAAIQLMRRVGVPEGVDLHRLRRALERPPSLMSSLFGLSENQVLSRLALLEFDRAFPDRQLRWYELLWELRQFLASTLLIALCVISIRRAPVGRKATA